MLNYYVQWNDKSFCSAHYKKQRERFLPMITYQVNEHLYFDTEHKILLSTTEYKQKDETIACLQMNGELFSVFNGIVKDQCSGAELRPEEFIYTGAKGKARIDRRQFEEMAERFKAGGSTAEREILEEYAYTGKDGQTGSQRIVVRMQSGEMTVEIEFGDVKEFENFVFPDWVIC